MSVNKVILLGRLGADPEIRQAGNSDVASLRVATSERWKDKRDGEFKEKTEWHRVSVWGEEGKGTLKFIADNLSKGDQVYIEGKIETRKYDKDEVDHYATEIQVPMFGGSVQKIWDKNGDNDNDRGGSSRGRGGDDDRGSRGRSSSRGRDDDRGDDRGSSRGRGRDDDRGDDRGGSGRGGGRGGNSRDDRSSDDRGGAGRGGSDRGASARGGGRNADMDDDIPF